MHNSYKTTCRQEYVQTRVCADKSMCRQECVQARLCADKRMCRQEYVQTRVCADRAPIIGVCAYRSMCR